ncbi:MAG: peptidoglycan DD-metalloendopeptidase family protein [Chitinispirillaceae bacterium]|nr:peptidoglycan DD-metalloendopeptidase family protein [Chitinispirillaceae bacterium]
MQCCRHISGADLINSNNALKLTVIILSVSAVSMARDSLSVADSSFETDQNESAFQEGIEAFFSEESAAIDTSDWNSAKINATRFDYRLMTDTARVVLADSSAHKKYVHPIIGPITSPFGLRRSIWHYGNDIRVQRKDTIRCAFDGIVRVIMNDRHGYGKVVVVRHHDQIETLYGHLSKTSVSLKQRIAAGDAVGLGGNTGRSTGPHLHFEMRYKGEPLDPNRVIDFETGTLKCDTLALCRETFAYLAEARSTVYHVIRRGETLGRIARRHGTTIGRLCALNGVGARTILSVGRKLVIRKNPVPEMSSNETGGG